MYKMCLHSLVLGPCKHLQCICFATWHSLLFLTHWVQSVLSVCAERWGVGALHRSMDSLPMVNPKEWLSCPSSHQLPTLLLQGRPVVGPPPSTLVLFTCVISCRSQQCWEFMCVKCHASGQNFTPPPPSSGSYILSLWSLTSRKSLHSAMLSGIGH